MNDAEAVIVREIFERYAAGESAKTIAHDLNRRRVPWRGASWKHTDRVSGWTWTTICMLSGLLKCACCGSSYSMRNDRNYGCAGYVRGLGLAAAQYATLSAGEAAELAKVEREIGNAVDALVSLGKSAAVLALVRELESRKATLESQIRMIEKPPRLVPMSSA